MKVGITVNELDFSSLEEMFSTLRQYGFEAVDYTGLHVGMLKETEEKEYCKRLVSAAKAAGVTISQTHAPFLINCSEEEFFSDKFRKSVEAAIERTARLEAPYLVVHPYVPQGLEFFLNARPYDYSKLIEHNKEVNVKYFEQFVPLLEKTGVKICIENLFAYDVLMQRHVLSVCGSADEANYYIDTLGDEHFGCCYDSGHLNHFGANAGEYIRKLGKRIKVVHLNDSWGKNFFGMDWHLMPGQGDVDWEDVAAALKEVGYEGTASFEISPRKGKFFFPQLKYIGDMGNLIFNAR